MPINNGKDVEEDALRTCALWGCPRFTVELELAQLLGRVLTASGVEVEVVKETAQVRDDLKRKGVKPDEA